MKTQKIALVVQKKLAHTLTRQLQRSRSIPEYPRYGECWPQSNGREKTVMWQSTGWPASGKNMPRTAQRFLLPSRFFKG